jgi:hypothetical protein
MNKIRLPVKIKKIDHIYLSYNESYHSVHFYMPDIDDAFYFDGDLYPIAWTKNQVGFTRPDNTFCSNATWKKK